MEKEEGSLVIYLMEKKDATYDYQHIDWERHYSGKAYYGISPVKIIQNGAGRKGLVAG